MRLEASADAGWSALVPGLSAQNTTTKEQTMTRLAFRLRAIWRLYTELPSGSPEEGQC